ncbi:ATP-binding protein [Pectobacterium carotovorum]|uniref:AAA family ATPase n=1 Tax=Pectobacterium carotovorum TaxID=554 RepID=UPI001CF4CDE4|nr:AAA family ATPase [Pectobacterium carotovorum]MCA6972147.1 ATP-binding protein [Pectobacterium carotovorum]
MDIKQLKIDNLYGEYDCELNIESNVFILVGENGTGKSTVLAMLYYILKRKWRKLIDYYFDNISLIINNESFEFEKNDLIEYLDKHNNVNHKSKAGDIVKNYVLKNISRQEINILKENMESINPIVSKVSDGLRRDMRIAFPSRVIRAEILDLIYTDVDVEYKILNNPIRRLDVYLRRNLNIPILYLPTYRRIEHDLEKIIPYFSRDVFDRKSNLSVENVIDGELVNFGMSDVDNLIRESMSSLSSEFRNGMKELIGRYLQDILTHKYDSSLLKDEWDVESKNIDSILARVDADTLSVEIKREIQRKIKSANSSSSDIDIVVKYFILNLINLDKIQSNREEDVNNFVDICNNYLVNKKIIFDKIKFDIYIKSDLKKNTKSDEVEKIKWDVLSSGEKQIVSLFAKLILDKKDEFILIIDEPELSLSILWQENFLMDIAELKNCSGLFSVTHSPFIYKNKLKRYTQSIGRVLKVK